MQEKKKRTQTVVTLTDKEYNHEKKCYNSTVQTKYYGELPFTLTIYEKPLLKEGAWGSGYIIGQLEIASKVLSIWEQDGKYGKQYSTTIAYKYLPDGRREKDFFMRIERVLSRSKVPAYDAIFIEREEEEIEDPEIRAERENLPF